MRKILFTVLGLMVAAGAQAAEVGGVKLDDKATLGGQELVLNGAGVRSRALPRRMPRRGGGGHRLPVHVQ